MQDARLEDLPYEECLRLLRERSVGRIAVVINDFPTVLPVNYRLVETSGPTGSPFERDPATSSGGHA